MLKFIPSPINRHVHIFELLNAVEMAPGWTKLWIIDSDGNYVYKELPENATSKKVVLTAEDVKNLCPKMALAFAKINTTVNKSDQNARLFYTWNYFFLHYYKDMGTLGQPIVTIDLKK